MQSPPTVLCDYCGQLFDTRKALSCHARAHLRHLGLAWSIRTSPIDLLKEVMIHGVESVKESAASGSSAKAALSPQGSRKSLEGPQPGEPDSKSCTSPLNYSLKEKSPSVKSAAPHPGETFHLNFAARRMLPLPFEQEPVFRTPGMLVRGRSADAPVTLAFNRVSLSYSKSFLDGCYDERTPEQQRHKMDR